MDYIRLKKSSSGPGCILQNGDKSRNQYTNALKKSKSAYIQQEIENSKNDNKKMWEVLKRIVKTKTQIEEQLTIWKYRCRRSSILLIVFLKLIIAFHVLLILMLR